MSLPAPGTRISFAGNLGTVRYSGNVIGTSGAWLGVEWDDPRRGKHNGSKDGIQYFSCRIPNAGSFIRPSANVLYGVSFLDALQSKYIDLPHGPHEIERIVLGSSNGAIQVEAANLDKIRQKFSDLSRLREISLDGLLVSHPDEPGKIKNTCPSVRGLNLSMSLVPSWQSVAAITSELPLLERLELNSNRFLPLHIPCDLTHAFLTVTHLQLNKTLTTWSDAQIILSFMPKLHLIELGYNRLEYLSDPPSQPSLLPNATSATIASLQTLNLDSNHLGDWVHIQLSLQPYISLTRLILNSNNIRSIPHPASDQVSSAIKAISLSANKLDTWSSIDALYQWFPNLEILHILDNPFLQDREMGRSARQFIIAKIPSLKILDGTDVSSRERIDSELFYLSYIAKTEVGIPKETRNQIHPQWDALRRKHGMLEDAEAPPAPNTDRMKNRLIGLNTYQRPQLTTPVAEVLMSQPMELRVLPSMRLQTLRLKLRKATKSNANASHIMIWALMDDDKLAELTIESDRQDLAWLGLDQNSSIIFYINE